MDGLDRHRIEIQTARPAILLADQQSSLFQNLEMIHDRNAGDIKGFCKLTNPLPRLITHQVKNAPPRLMREGVKDQIHIVVSNHVIT